MPASLPTLSLHPDLASQQRRGAWGPPPRGGRGCALSGGFSPIQFFATPQTAARQVPLSTGFSRQEYWSGLPFPTPEDLPDPWTEPMFPEMQVDSLPLSHWESPHYLWRPPPLHLQTGDPGGSVAEELVIQSPPKPSCRQVL